MIIIFIMTVMGNRQHIQFTHFQPHHARVRALLCLFRLGQVFSLFCFFFFMRCDCVAIIRQNAQTIISTGLTVWIESHRDARRYRVAASNRFSFFLSLYFHLGVFCSISSCTELWLLARTMASKINTESETKRTCTADIMNSPLNVAAHLRQIDCQMEERERENWNLSLNWSPSTRNPIRIQTHSIRTHLMTAPFHSRHVVVQHSM